MYRHAGDSVLVQVQKLLIQFAFLLEEHIETGLSVCSKYVYFH
jgi:hypothetical protein